VVAGSAVTETRGQEVKPFHFFARNGGRFGLRLPSIIVPRFDRTLMMVRKGALLATVSRTGAWSRGKGSHRELYGTARTSGSPPIDENLSPPGGRRVRDRPIPGHGGTSGAKPDRDVKEGAVGEPMMNLVEQRRGGGVDGIGIRLLDDREERRPVEFRQGPHS
jgi:hypothetical protein